MPNPLVAVVMGSTSDWPVMQHATECLEQFGIEFEAKVVSAHRTPDLLAEFGKQARANGFACIIDEEDSIHRIKVPFRTCYLEFAGWISLC